jgi:hypothetical protein
MQECPVTGVNHASGPCSITAEGWSMLNARSPVFYVTAVHVTPGGVPLINLKAWPIIHLIDSTNI